MKNRAGSQPNEAGLPAFASDVKESPPSGEY